MRIHEYQSYQLLAEAGVPGPPFGVAHSADEAVAAWRKIGGRVVVKAQVFAGGRGKAGFVRLCGSEEEVRTAAEFMLTHRMVGRQTGPQGVAVRKLLVAAAVDIEKEYYVGMAIDRARRCPVIMVSRQGGVEIEEVAAREPEAIVKEWLHPHLGLRVHPRTLESHRRDAGATRVLGCTVSESQIGKLTEALGLMEEAQTQAAGAVIRGLASAFLRYDASLAEINPLVLTRDGRLLAIDAKMNFDDNALFRQQAILELYDASEENPNELRAKAAGLSYIALDGNIGCLVNGAGLAMATMDLIKLHGGEPANFLDVGGSVTTEGAVEALRIILNDRKVKGVLVNIFGGIARCDTIAEALVAAARDVGFDVPVVVRLEGTHVELARELLKKANLPGLIAADDLTDAAKKVCAVV